MSTVVHNISGFDSPLARGLCWAAAWDMARDAELAARDYVQLVCAGLPVEPDINLVTATLRQAQGAISQFADESWIPTGWQLLADTAKAAAASATPGSGFQLAWVRAFVHAARSTEDLAALRGWLDGTGVPNGLPIDTDLRWSLVAALTAAGAIDAPVIDAEFDRDRTTSGERSATLARSLLPTALVKSEIWRRLTGEEKLPNTQHRALLQGFYHPAQLALTEQYVPKYFDVIDEIWATRDSEPAQEFAMLAFPSLHISQATVDATNNWLASEGHPASLRRLVAEGKDGIERALRARAKDAA